MNKDKEQDNKPEFRMEFAQELIENPAISSASRSRVPPPTTRPRRSRLASPRLSSPSSSTRVKPPATRLQRPDRVTRPSPHLPFSARPPVPRARRLRPGLRSPASRCPAGLPPPPDPASRSSAQSSRSPGARLLHPDHRPPARPPVPRPGPESLHLRVSALVPALAVVAKQRIRRRIVPPRSEMSLGVDPALGPAPRPPLARPSVLRAPFCVDTSIRPRLAPPRAPPAREPRSLTGPAPPTLEPRPSRARPALEPRPSQAPAPPDNSAPSRRPARSPTSCSGPVPALGSKIPSRPGGRAGVQPAAEEPRVPPPARVLEVNGGRTRGRRARRYQRAFRDGKPPLPADSRCPFPH
ncbi:proline-rich protein 2-like [Dama dama]|uniref:proline-rich protein 2-like n=1 Tax=Dama dama TaxID=30532 RepID=UPI002A36432E|nr:proline-rich protein 2-like [Dama dama]